MKILILSWRCIKNPEAGGSEIYFNELAKRWVKQGNEVEWFSPEFSGSKREEICDGIKIIRRGNRASVYLKAFLYYLKKSDEYDFIIDVENGIPFFSPFYFANRKIVLHLQHVHDRQWFKEFKFPIANLGYFLEMKLMPLIYKKIPVITISKSSLESILKRKIGKGIPQIVNPGIRFYKFKKFSKNKKPAILFLNRIKKYKGVDYYLSVANKLKNEEIEFWLAGDGSYLPNVKEYIKKNNLENINIFGKISEQKKSELMQRAWIFVNPSSREGWGIVNIEANYFSVPVLGSNVNGIKDSIVDGKTGLLFEYGNYNELAEKIKDLVKDKKLLSQMSKNAKEWAKKFSWDLKAKEYLETLKSLNK